MVATHSQRLSDYIKGRDLSASDGSAFIEKMLEAYPIEPALGAPFDGRNTTYGQPPQYKRLAAIAGDTSYTAPWRWYLDAFSKTSSVWGIQFEEPFPGAPVALGVHHGSDLAYYFPEMLGGRYDASRNKYGGLINTIHDALINFVTYGNPNGQAIGCGEGGGYCLPEFGESGLVTALNASHLAAAIEPPYRPGFEVIEQYLID